MAKLYVPILVDWESIKNYMETHDIVEVVRCKDCKHRIIEPCAGGTYIGCESISGPDGCPMLILYDDWFCADGERRDDGDSD